ncbi:MAG TPA: DUF4189 domain-containing protein [Stellaceae bacterium]|nr:DUF4189 domain-containing protein [Stellaceae bacterium]
MRTMMTTALAVMLTAAGPAFAASGAIAYDQATGRYGLAWNKATQQQANDAAMKDCGSDKCKLIPVPGGKCAALATGADEKENNAWGVSVRGGKPEAELAAMQNCQKRTSGQCKIRGSECNR